MLTAQPLADFTLDQDSLASFRCRCRVCTDSTASGRLENDGIDLYDVGRKATCVANPDGSNVELDVAFISNIKAARTAKIYSDAMIMTDGVTGVVTASVVRGDHQNFHLCTVLLLSDTSHVTDTSL